MNKKGLSYIDWAISFGIFIIYLLIVFILITPNLARDYDNDFLTSIIKEGLEEDTYIKLSIYPLFVEPGGHMDDITLNLPPSYTFLNDTNMIILDESSNKLEMGASGGDLSFIYAFKATNKFTIIHSDELVYSNAISSLSPSIDFNYTIGVKESLKGIYVPYFNTLPADYRSLKSQWNFPTSKEFAIEIYEGVNLSNQILNYTRVEPNLDSTVRVLKWSEWQIHNDSERELVTILVKTW